MPIQKYKPAWWQSFFRFVGSTRLGVWLFSSYLPNLDHFVISWSNGKHSVTEFFTGWPIVTLTVIGAKSRKPRSVPIVGIESGDEIILIASNFGRNQNPAWYYNINAFPIVKLLFNGKIARYLARELIGEERHLYWSQVIDRFPVYASYQKRSGGREIPLIQLTPMNHQETHINQ